VSNSKSAGIFDKIMGAFVEETPDAQKAPAAPPPAPVAVPYRAAIPYSAQPVADPAITAKLEAKLAVAMPAIYAAFIEQYEGLKDFIPDEGTRFKAALKASKATVEQLSSALDTLVVTMNTAKGEFEKTFDANRSKTLSGAQENIDKLSSAIADREMTVRALTAEIAKLQDDRGAEQQRMATEQHRLDGLRGGFEAAHASVLGRLNEQKARIASQRG
jgi:archaellum component FlaC